MIAYPLGGGKIDDEFEKMIEELRDKKKFEERLKAEEKKHDLENLKKQQEIQEKKKAGKKAIYMAENQAYDKDGKVVDLQEFKDFPQLATKCSTVLKQTQNEESAKKQKMMRSTRKKTQKRDDEGKGWEWEFRRGSGSTERTEVNRYSISMQKVYESIIPAAGVTVMENGKNPKSSTLTVSQKTGRYSKTEMYFSGTEGPLKTTSMTQLPPIIPISIFYTNY